MIIAETREQLVSQLQAAWAVIAEADEALDKAAASITEAHRRLRLFSQGANDSTTHTRDNVDTATKQSTEATQQTKGVRGVPVTQRKFVLRSRRDTT